MKIVFAIVLFCPWLVVAEKCGNIEQIKGTVEIHRLKGGEEEVRKAISVTKVPFAIECSDVIVTRADSAARVRNAGTVLTMSSNTRVVAPIKEKGGPNLIDLSFGKIRSFFKGKSEKTGANLKVTTPVAVVGVRGTDFYASFNLNDFEMRQATLTGEVTVMHKQTQIEVPVKAGEQAIARPIEAVKDLDKNIPQPKKLVFSEKENSLKVIPLDEATKIKVREASVLAQKVPEFESKEAVQVIGPSEKWEPVDSSQVPDDLKNIENKF